ncbi:MAG: hypothetical protein LH606_03175 [Cytophagaceae bacterium]|nr:hypothetical protein [Cytophagaceae bacterium]
METKPKRRSNLTPLPKGFTLDPTMNPNREQVGLAEKLAHAAASIEKYGLPGKVGRDGLEPTE